MFIQTLFNNNCDGVQTCIREKPNHLFLLLNDYQNLFVITDYTFNLKDN